MVWPTSMVGSEWPPREQSIPEIEYFFSESEIAENMAMRVLIPRIAREHANAEYIRSAFAAKAAGAVTHVEVEDRYTGGRDGKGGGWKKAWLTVEPSDSDKGLMIKRKLEEGGRHEFHYSKDTPWFFWHLTPV